MRGLADQLVRVLVAMLWWEVRLRLGTAVRLWSGDGRLTIRLRHSKVWEGDIRETRDFSLPYCTENTPRPWVR